MAKQVCQIIKSLLFTLCSVYIFHSKQGKRKTGCPKLMFHQYIAGIISKAHPPMPEEIRSMAQDRKEWRKLVAECSTLTTVWFINSVDKPNFRVSLPHRRSTTVSLETNPLYSFECSTVGHI